LNRIANWQDLEGFPCHLRVLHVRQELHTENEETTVLQAVLEADIERQTLLQEEKELLLRLENQDDTVVESEGTAKIEERSKQIAQTTENDAAFGEDLRKLKEVYERLQLLSADTAQARAAMILSGLCDVPAYLQSCANFHDWRLRQTRKGIGRLP
jgi:ATP-binding cassette subfamily F protein 3